MRSFARCNKILLICPMPKYTSKVHLNITWVVVPLDMGGTKVQGFFYLHEKIFFS
jgi:hypothetical protein